ncbi:MAG: zinc-ribbon domain containing protein [Tepidisphaeraceae bacterium]
MRLRFYEDQPFTCVDCGKHEVWSAAQQKWWYEVAKGDVWTVAQRCRLCRRRERERKNEARSVHLEGLARKAEKKPS